MKRPPVLLATLGLTAFLGWGCGGYDLRLDKTLDRLREKARLDQYLNPPVEAKFKEHLIYLRTPKPLPQQPEEFRHFQGVPEGAFDIQSSFRSFGKENKLSLGCHVLVRHKKPQAANPKNAPNPAADAARGPFNADVIELIARAHNVPLTEADGKPAREKGNSFKRYDYKVGDNTIHAYLYNTKAGADTYDVALIWEIPPDQIKETATSIELCLRSFAVGPIAAKLFETGFDEDESAGGEGTAF